MTAPGIDEVLEVKLPAVSGDELRRRLEATGKATVILLLTADDVAENLKTGAVAGGSADSGATVQPSSPVVLAARLSPLHHDDVVVLPTVQLGPLRVDFDRTRAWVGAEALSVTPRELVLLTYLAHRAGQVVTKTEILRYVWGESERNPNLVEVAIGKLRRKLEHSEISILTVRGAGYQLTF